MSIGTACGVLVYFIDCGMMPRPENGNVNQSMGTTYGRTVHFTCSLGYEIFGSKQSTCMANGQWSHEAPVCKLTGTCSSLFIYIYVFLHSFADCIGMAIY